MSLCRLPICHLCGNALLPYEDPPFRSKARLYLTKEKGADQVCYYFCESCRESEAYKNLIEQERMIQHEIARDKWEQDIRDYEEALRRDKERQKEEMEEARFMSGLLLFGAFVVVIILGLIFGG